MRKYFKELSEKGATLCYRAIQLLVHKDAERKLHAPGPGLSVTRLVNKNFISLERVLIKCLQFKRGSIINLTWNSS